MYCWVRTFALSPFISWFICFWRWCIDKPNIYVSWSTSELRVRLAPWNQFKHSCKKVFLTAPRRYFFCGSFVFFCFLCFSCFRVCSLLPCGHLLEKGWPLSSFLVMFIIFFVTFPFGILGQVWYLMVSFPDLCRLSYFLFMWAELAWAELFFAQNSKWVWSGNTTITNCRQPRGTARKSRSIITSYQEDKLSKATSSLFPIKMIAILEWT